MSTNENSYLFLGNNLAIDFVNTVVADNGRHIDLIKNKQDIVEWGQEAGFEMENYDGSIDIAAIKAFRESLRLLLIENSHDESKDRSNAITVVNQLLTAGGEEKKLISVDGKWILTPVHEALSLDMLLGRIANDAANLLSSPKISKIKCCANPNCVLTFLDTSRTGARRWCSMKTCGNRSKAASYYSKQ